MSKELDIKLINSIAEKYGTSFYLLDTDVFEKNCLNLLDSFKKYYDKTNLAYSYKTNYIPRLVQTVDKIGGFAEVVSDMEMEIALKSGVSPDKIIWNGPVKNLDKVAELLLSGGTVNIDSLQELEEIKEIAEKNQDNKLNIGVRVNFDDGDGVLSRFGIDVSSGDFDIAMKTIVSVPNLTLKSFQSHFAKRDPKYWTKRAEGMVDIYERASMVYGLNPERLDLGGGIYGDMPDELRNQLHVDKYSFEDYSSRAAKVFEETFGNDKEDRPWLFIEPGTAVAANCMRYVCHVETIKNVRGKFIATVDGSQKNISMSGINPPMTVIAGANNRSEYQDLDIAGYTCIESDYLFKGYKGELGVGDYIVLGSCGSYSVVMKPPFIFPNVSIVDISTGDVELIKRSEVFEDLFHTYSF